MLSFACSAAVICLLGCRDRAAKYRFQALACSPKQIIDWKALQLGRQTTRPTETSYVCGYDEQFSPLIAV